MNENTPLLSVEMKGKDGTSNRNKANNKENLHDSWKINIQEEEGIRKELNAADRALFHAASSGDLEELKKVF